MNLLNQHLQELLRLHALTQHIEGNDYHPCDPLLLRQLVNYVTSSSWYMTDNGSEIFKQPIIHPCGCMGPQFGNPFCSCRMRNLVYKHRYEIAIIIQQENLFNH